MSNQKLDTIIEELKFVNKSLFAIAFGFEDDEDFEERFSEEIKNAEITKEEEEGRSSPDIETNLPQT